MRKKKILALSDSPFLNTGYSSQMLALLNGLSGKGWECHWQVTNQTYTGQTLPPGSVKLADGTPFNFTLYSAGREAYAKDVLIPRLKSIKPDIFITLLDTFMMHPWYQTQNFSPALSAFWFPSDGGKRLPLNCEHVLNHVQIPVAMSKYGQAQAKKRYGLKVHYIPHGINPDLFYPLSDEEKFELKTKWGLTNKFVIGLMGRNQNRKFHSRALKIFQFFARRHPDVVMLCHLDPNDVAATFCIRSMIKDLGLENRVFFTGTKYYEGFTYKQMNDVYNLMDIYLSTTSGEGFGVGTIEAMSCKIPIVITDYTTTQELVTDHDAGKIIKLRDELTGSMNVERGLCDITDGIEKLEKLYFDFQLRQKYGENGRKAVLENYTEEIVVNKWQKLLDEKLSQL